MKKILDTTQNVDNLDGLLFHVLTDVADGKVSVEQARSGLAELIHLIDNRNPNAEEWLKQGRKFICN